VKQETRKALNHTADLAARALHFLIADGKLAIRDVTTALSRRKRLIKELANRFTALETEKVAGSAKARKGAPRKAAKSAPRKASARKTRSAKDGAYSAAKAGKATRKKTVARTARRKARTPKAAASIKSSKPTQRPITGPRPGIVRAKTKRPAQIAVTAEAAEQKHRPSDDMESSIQTPTPAPKPAGRKLPKVAHPEHEGTGPGARDWSRT
jgi:hypothetical protein